MTPFESLFLPQLLVSLSAASPNSLDGEISVQPDSPVARKRLSEESISEKKPKTAKKEVTRPHERYGEYDPNREHPIMALGKHIEGEKKTYWYFILSLLTDRTKKDVISWTGRGYEFACVNPKELIKLWRIEQEKEKVCQWDSLRRNFRSCYKRRIMIPVNARRHIFAFITEPSVHLNGWTKQRLEDYIKENSLPHCTCSSSQSQFSSPHYEYDHNPPPPLRSSPSPRRSNSRREVIPTPSPSVDSTPSPVSSPSSPLGFSIARLLGM